MTMQQNNKYMKLKINMFMPLLAAALCLSPGSSRAAGAQAVFDMKSYQESLTQKLQNVEQWNIQNKNDLEQLSAMQSSYDLQVQNSTKNNAQTWDGLESVKDDTANLLSASKALWEEYGSASQYYASFKKSEYWQQCLAAGNCLEDGSLSEQDEATISFALKAYKSADLAQEQLDAKLEALNELSSEAKGAQSFADNIDVLSKINTNTASMLLDLNSQISTMVQIFSHDMAAGKSREVASSEYTSHLQRTDSDYEAKSINYSYSSRIN